MHVAASQSIWCFICKWCSAMWLLTSPFLVAGLRSVSRVLRFLCRCRPSCTVLLFILAGKSTQYVYIILDSFSCQYEKQYSTRWKATAKNWKQVVQQRNKHRTSVGREGLVPKSQSLLVNVYFRLDSARGSTPRSWPGLFKRWIALSTGQITIQRISIRETNCAIQRIEIYPEDSLIHLLNNWGLVVYFCYGLNSCSHWAKSGRNLSDMWRFTI